jgi:serine/threonine protein kinase
MDMSTPPQGVAECHYFGIEGPWNCLVMEILGKSLEDQVQACKGQLTQKTTVLIAQQVLQRIEYLHSKGLVHRDIKPENFMFGVNKKVHHVYIIDFGLSKKYWDQPNGKHCSMRTRLSLTGTARYASINAHKGVEQSRRDDLEAIGHMLLYFLRGALPWSGLDAKTQEEKYRKICEKKEQTPITDLNTDPKFSKNFESYLEYCRNLGFTDLPNYTGLQKWMADVREESWKDWDYQWFDERANLTKHCGDEQDLVPVTKRGDGPVQPDKQKKAPPKSGALCCLCGSKNGTRD